MLDTALDHWQGRRFKEAEKIYLKLLAQIPGHGGVWKRRDDLMKETNWYGDVFYNYGGVKKDLGDIAGAKSYYDKALGAMRPDKQFMVQYSLGMIQLEEGNVKSAVENFDQARHHATPDLVHRMAGQITRYAQAYQMEASKSAAPYDHLWRAGYLSSAVGRSEESDSFFRRAFRVYDRRSRNRLHPVLLYEAATRKHADDKEEAAELYRECISHAEEYGTDDKRSYIADSWVQLGNLAEDAGEGAEESLRLFRKAWKADGRHHAAVVSIGRMLGILKRHDEALEVFRRAVETGALMNVYQRPSELLRDLTPMPWHDTMRLRAARVLKRAYPMIREEVLALMKKGLLEKEGVRDTEGLTGSGRWTELNLFFQALPPAQ